MFRRNESTNQWIDAPDNEVNDDDLLAISREEYEGEMMWQLLVVLHVDFVHMLHRLVCICHVRTYMPFLLPLLSELKKNEVHSYVDLCASSKSKGETMLSSFRFDEFYSVFV